MRSFNDEISTTYKNKFSRKNHSKEKNFKYKNKIDKKRFKEAIKEVQK